MNIKEQHIWKTDRALGLNELRERIPDYENDDLILYTAELNIKPGSGIKLIAGFELGSYNPLLEFYSQSGFVTRGLLVNVKCEEEVFRRFSENSKAGYLVDKLVFTFGLTRSQSLAFDQNLQSFDH